MPANLQGLWNEHLVAPWNSDYHLNINLQMNYWHAETTGMPNAHLPMFDYLERLMPAQRKVAADLGCKGIAGTLVSDAWNWQALYGHPQWGWWMHGAGWSSAHFMEHYRFNRDKSFLQKRAYPYLKACAEFYLDWLVADPATGKLVSGPTVSPENAYRLNGKTAYLSMGCAMDQWIILEVFTNTLEAAKALGINDAFTRQVEAALPNVQVPNIGHDGRLLEWDKPYEEAEPGHRHMSHLYGMHPANLVTATRTAPLFDAMRKSLDHRLAQGGGHTGWSRAWVINFFARFKDGEKAHENLRALLSKSTYPNLFDDHPPFQIDGNFGGSAGIAEMLVQSHDQGIELLPALPKAWRTGRAAGLRARGGYVIDEVVWRDGRLVSATISAIKGVAKAPIVLENGRTLPIKLQKPGVWTSTAIGE